jgi:hypothetical protein
VQVISIDRTSLETKTLQDAKRMFMGNEGTSIEVSVQRPSTGEVFNVMLRRQLDDMSDIYRW